MPPLRVWRRDRLTVENSPRAWSERARQPAPWAAAAWSERGQTRRFLALLGHLELRAGDELLDFGAGTGRLCEWLPAGIAYFAYDWADGMRDRAAREHPAAVVLDTIPDRLFDHVVCVGAMNLTDGWSKERTWETLADLWANSTRRTLAVSLYRGRDPQCLTYCVNDAAALAERLDVRDVVIDGSYLDNDLLLVLRR